MPKTKADRPNPGGEAIYRCPDGCIWTKAELGPEATCPRSGRPCTVLCRSNMNPSKWKYPGAQVVNGLEFRTVKTYAKKIWDNNDSRPEPILHAVIHGSLIELRKAIDLLLAEGDE